MSEPELPTRRPVDEIVSPATVSMEVMPEEVPLALAQAEAAEEQVEDRADEEVAQPAAAPPRDEIAAAAVPRAKRANLGRQAKAASVTFAELGHIAYHVSRQAFEARCILHPGCSLTRTSKGRHSSAMGIVAGRPLGLMSAWLLAADAHDTKESHVDTSWWPEQLSPDAREAGRVHLLTLDGGPELAEFERAPVEGEGEEPATLAGLMR